MRYTFQFKLFGKKKCANNKALKCYGSDAWGQDVQAEWSEI